MGKKVWETRGCTFDVLKEELNKLSEEGFAIYSILPLARNDRNDVLIIASK